MSRFVHGGQVQANGIRQHYLRYGGKGPTLVLVPGITSPAITWGFVAEVFARHFDIWVLDVRGRGLSSSGEGLDYDMETCADDINGFVKAMNFQQYHLVGHSMGPRFIMRSAVKQPEAVLSLTLIDPPVSGPDRRPYPSQWPWYQDSIREAVKGMDAEAMKKYCPSWSEEQRQLRAEWLHTCYEPAIRRAFDDFHQLDIHQYFSQLPAKTLLMVAGKGGVIQPEDEAEIRQLLPSIEISHVPDAGHMIPWDDLSGFFTALGTFLGPTLQAETP